MRLILAYIVLTGRNLGYALCGAYAKQTEGEKSYALSVSFTDIFYIGRGKIISLPNIMGRWAACNTKLHHSINRNAPEKAFLGSEIALCVYLLAPYSASSLLGRALRLRGLGSFSMRE